MTNSKNVDLVMGDSHFLLVCNFVIYYLKLRGILLYIEGSRILCAIMHLVHCLLVFTFVILCFTCQVKSLYYAV